MFPHCFVSLDAEQLFSILWGERRKDYTQPRINTLKNRFGKLSRVKIVTVNRSSCKLMIRAKKSKC